MTNPSASIQRSHKNAATCKMLVVQFDCELLSIINPPSKAKAEGYCNHLAIFCPSVCPYGKGRLRESMHPRFTIKEDWSR